MFEHRLYLPMFGFSIVVIYVTFGFLLNRRSEATAILGLIILSLGTTTFMRNKVWQDSVTLWNDVVSKNELNFRGYNNLGAASAKLGKFKEAIGDCSKALNIKPDFAEAHNNLVTFKSVYIV